MSDRINRRDFIKGVAVTGAGIYGLTRNLSIAKASSNPKLAVARGDVSKGTDPAMVKSVARRAVEILGGMSKFVSSGSVVLVKPNIGWNRMPQQAANTNPDVVEEVVRMCLEAGAKKVRVLDNSVNEAEITYKRSGIEAAVKRAGGSIEFAVERKFKEKSIPDGEVLDAWPIFEDALDVDVFINVPIAKHHSLTKLTLGIKNLMGLILDRNDIHTRITPKLADLATVLKPHLIIMDAYRILTAHGPNSGTPKDVKLAARVIAGTDPIAVDSYTSTLFGLKGEDIGYVKAAYDRGLGEIDLEKIAIQEVSVK